MNPSHRFSFAGGLLCLLAAAAPLHGAGYKSAEFTRLHNQVQVLKSDAPPRPATLGESINAVTSVSTGSDSRAELRFEDKSLTRLGSNTRFTLRGDQRTLDLNQGVMLLQVPKKIGGAKVRTAAVTAAVTGTTVLFEYLPDGFIKLIVIEGQVDLYFNDQPGKFITLSAGQMIIMPANATEFPQPVDIDLERLLKTSKLISGDDIGMINQDQVADALKDQKKAFKKGTLLATNLVIPGLGTVAQLTNERRLELADTLTVTPTPGQNPPKHPSNPPDGGPNNPPAGDPDPGSDPDPVLNPLIPGTTILDENATVYTNPHLEIRDPETEEIIETHLGDRYPGSPDYPQYAFASDSPLPPGFQDYLTDRGEWASFRFEDLIVQGTPVFSLTGEDPSTNVIFASLNDIRFRAPPQSLYGYLDLGLDYPYLTDIVFYTRNGSINLDANFGIYNTLIGTAPNLALIAGGPDSNLTIDGTINLAPGGQVYSFSVQEEASSTGGHLVLSAGNDITITGSNPQTESYNSITAGKVEARAGNNMRLNRANINAPTIKLAAVQNISITSSSQLYALADHADQHGHIQILSEQGDVSIGDADGFTHIQAYDYYENGHNKIEVAGRNINLTNVNITTDIFKARAFGSDGALTISGDLGNAISASQLIKLYAEGANGTIRFLGNTTLEGGSIHIAAQKSVEILQDKTVIIYSGSPAKIYTPESGRHYNTSGYGAFEGSIKSKDFSKRPAY